MTRLLTLFALVMTFTLGGLTITGCEDKGGMEEVGENVDEAVEDTGEALEDAGEDVEDAVEDATDGN